LVDKEECSFLKKRTKKLLHPGGPFVRACAPRIKSFLLLFFKKEGFSSFGLAFQSVETCNGQTPPFHPPKQSYALPGMETSQPKLQANLVAILPAAGLDGPALACVAEACDAAQAIDRLEAAKMLAPAVRLYAFALPRREAVWWASMCAAATPSSGQPAPERHAREAAEEWVRRQDEPSRRAAMAAARAAGFRAPEAWAAVAAFWSDGSIAPPGQPIVPPAPHLTGTAVHGAVSMAAVRGKPQRRDERLRRFLASARDIAGGGGGHIEPEPA
jgi:hypothetical protein